MRVYYSPEGVVAAAPAPVITGTAGGTAGGASGGATIAPTTGAWSFPPVPIAPAPAAGAPAAAPAHADFASQQLPHRC